MTPKVEELVARLREEIRGRESEPDHFAEEVTADMREAADSLTTLSARVMELEAALEPFAELGRIVLAEAPPGAETVGLFASSTGERAKVRLADFRRARDALQSSPIKE
jgi:hypothetical protein